MTDESEFQLATAQTELPIWTYEAARNRFLEPRSERDRSETGVISERYRSETGAISKRDRSERDPDPARALGPAPRQQNQGNMLINSARLE